MEIKLEHIEPKDIERHSMALIQQELDRRHIRLDAVEAPIVKRCIHTSADFDYAEKLVFSANAVDRMRTSLRAGIAGSASADASAGGRSHDAGAIVVTDTEMACGGISKMAIAELGA